MVSVVYFISSRDKSAELTEGLDLFEEAALGRHAELFFDGGR
jgi:hypothetical protein